MPTPSDDSAPSDAGIAALLGDENLMILAANPGDESLACGGLIARCCGRGRPPFVMLLADGSAGHADPDQVAAERERQTRAAMQCLGLPSERFLMAGLFEGTIPETGPVFEAVVRAVTLVMWARDCNVVCAPASNSNSPDQRATATIAAAIAARSGVARLAYGAAEGWRLDITAHEAAKRAALDAHTSQPHTAEFTPYELFVQTGRELFVQPGRELFVQPGRELFVQPGRNR